MPKHLEFNRKFGWFWLSGGTFVILDIEFAIVFAEIFNRKMQMVFKPNETSVQKQNSFSSDHLLAMCKYFYNKTGNENK